MATEQKSRRIQTKTAALLVIIVMFAAILLTTIALLRSNKAILSTTTIPMDLKLEDRFAFNLDKDAMHFGSMPPGNGASRSITISNNESFPVKARIYLQGEPLASWITPEETLVRLEPFAINRTINLVLKSPEYAEYGNYTGELTIVFKKA